MKLSEETNWEQIASFRLTRAKDLLVVIKQQKSIIASRDTVEFRLSPEVLEKIVEACAEEMYAGAIEVAEELKGQMLEWVAVHALPEKRNDGAIV